MTPELTATSDRPLDLKFQVGMKAVRIDRPGGSKFVVHEPVSGKTHELREDEYYVLTQLDGEVSLSELKRRYEHRFLDVRVTVGQLQSLLFRFHGNGLTRSERRGQGAAMLRRADAERRKKVSGIASQWMFLRFPGIDPSPLMRVLVPLCRPMLSRVGRTLLAGFAIASMMILCVELDRFRGELPSIDRYLTLDNAVILASVIGATKVLHELGHAVVSCSLGAPCKSIGVMLMVFTPALYCDVSPSWMLADRWKRIAIGAAGMAVEVLCACVAVWVWVGTPPGILHSIAAHVVVVCGVSTVLFNANPLLRYDGYYILSDATGVSNLGQRAQHRWRSFFRRRVLGINDPARRIGGVDASLWLLGYAVASAIYRWLMLATVVWFVWRVLRPVGLEIVGQTMASVVMAGLLFGWMRPIVAWFRDPSRRGRVKASRRWAIAGVVATFGFGLWIPLPSSVRVAGRMIPADESRVYVQAPGVLQRLLVAPGQFVEEGDLLAILRNVDLDLAMADAEGQVSVQEERVTSLQRSKHALPESFELVDTAESLLAQRREQLASVRRRCETLLMKSPRSGVVLAASADPNASDGGSPDRDRHWIDPDADADPTLGDQSIALTRWSGRPTDPMNEGCTLEAGTELLSIASLDRWLIEASVDAVQADRLSVGRDVVIVLDGTPDQRRRGKVARLSAQRSDPGSTDGSRRDDPEGTRRTRSPSVSYLVVVEMDAADRLATSIPVGASASCRIDAAKVSIAERLSHWFAGLFRFR